MRLTADAAEVLRLADGTRSLARIVGQLAERHPDAGGTDVIGPKVTSLLRALSRYAPRAGPVLLRRVESSVVDRARHRVAGRTRTAGAVRGGPTG